MGSWKAQVVALYSALAFACASAPNKEYVSAPTPKPVPQEQDFTGSLSDAVREEIFERPQPQNQSPPNSPPAIPPGTSYAAMAQAVREVVANTEEKKIIVPNLTDPRMKYVLAVKDFNEDGELDLGAIVHAQGSPVAVVLYDCSATGGIDRASVCAVGLSNCDTAPKDGKAQGLYHTVLLHATQFFHRGAREEREKDDGEASGQPTGAPKTWL